MAAAEQAKKARKMAKKARKATHGATVSAYARTKPGGRAVSVVARKKK